MNWSDIAVLAIIGLFAVIGFWRGLIKSIFKMVSFLISVVVSIKFYPVVSGYLEASPFYKQVWTYINKGILERQDVINENLNKTGDNIMSSTINSLELPDFIKNALLTQKPESSKIIDFKSSADALSDQLTGIVLNISSILLIFIAVSIALFLLKFLIDGISKLPVIKQLDKLGGFALGAVEGLISIYIIFGVLTLFGSVSGLDGVFASIQDSTVAKYFYDNNLIFQIIFSKPK